MPEFISPAYSLGGTRKYPNTNGHSAPFGRFRLEKLAGADVFARGFDDKVDGSVACVLFEGGTGGGEQESRGEWCFGALEAESEAVSGGFGTGN
jgi:hypothetical protein